MPNLMKALVKARAEEGLWMERVPVPEPGPDEVLIKVRKSAICGTDVHIWKWDEWSAKTVPVPMVTGHEFCGEIVDGGKAATKFRIGQRVSGEGHIVCGTCRNCRAGRGHLCRNPKGVGVNRPGSFAEYLCIPEANVVPIPDDIPDEIAAIFDPFGNAADRRDQAGADNGADVLHSVRQRLECGQSCRSISTAESLLRAFSGCSFRM